MDTLEHRIETVRPLLCMILTLSQGLAVEFSKPAYCTKHLDSFEKYLIYDCYPKNFEICVDFYCALHYIKTVDSS